MRMILLANFVDGVSHDNVVVDYPNMAGATGLNFSDLPVLSVEDTTTQTLDYMAMDGTRQFATLLLPSLVTLTDFADFSSSACPILSLPALQSITGVLTLTGADVITLSLPALQTLGAFEGGQLNNVGVVSLPNLTTIVAGFSLHEGQTTGINLPNLTSCRDFNFSDCVGGTFDLSSLATVTTGNFQLMSIGQQAELSLPALTSIGQSLVVTNNEALTSVSAPNLETAGGVTISNNFILEEILLPALTDTPSSALVITGNEALQHVDIAAYVGSSPNVNISSNPALTQIDFKNTNNATQWLLTGNALTQATVDAILAACVAGGLFDGTLSLNGGTNSAPSAGGLADKATLEANGWTVNVN